MKYRHIAHAFKTQEFLEGAGVRLHRGFSHIPSNIFDPFLLFDDFSSENPVDYMAGFPWHPHRGIETVTYILKGEVEHGDSLGNEGVIGKGDIQWMSAGNGIIHQEMPRGSNGLIGFQLWINMPAKRKMDTPRYQDHLAKLIPEFEYQKGAKARIIAGGLNDTSGPISDDMTDPTYIDFELSPNTEITVPVNASYTAFIYIFAGNVHAGSEKSGKQYGPGKVLLFDKLGDTVRLTTSTTGARLILVTGKPLNEAVAWHGPIVMNTQEELVQAFAELQDGTFIKQS
jgi:redox-sensitive bicupin YhaK (pirin superfamily)